MRLLVKISRIKANRAEDGDVMTDWLLKRTTGSGILMLNAEVLRSQRLTADLKCVLRLYVDDR